jgi:hemoglobin
MPDTLYARLGGYDAIAAVSDDLLVRLKADGQLARFWQHRGEDGLLREKQLLVNFLCASAGGPLHYVGRDMKTSHRGMGVNESDWQLFIGHLNATLDKFAVPAAERAAVLGFVDSTKADIVDRRLAAGVQAPSDLVPPRAG